MIDGELKALILFFLIACGTPAFGGLEKYSTLVKADPVPMTSAPPRGGVRITYLGTNGYLFESRETTLLVDPYFSRQNLFRMAFRLRPVPETQLTAQWIREHPKIDAVLATHGHVDIRSFTQRTANLPPSDTVRMLNEFLRVMVSVVETRHHGIINKFLGDGFMALFGIGENATNHADEAVATGCDVVSALDELNAQILREGRDPFAIGIGIHTGSAIVGSIGSPERLEFTAIGSAVNIASRIQGLTKTVQRALLLTEATAAHRLEKSALEEFPPQTVRGVEKPMRVYSVKISK